MVVDIVSNKKYKISSLEPKFDALEIVYKDFNDLKC